MQLILSYIEAGCCDFTRLFLVPFVAVQHAGDGMGAAADSYVEPIAGPSLVDRLDFDMLHFSAESLEEFAEKLVTHQQLERAGAVNDGAMALSARTIIAQLRALHDTSWGQTRHAEQKIVICNTAMGQSELQSVARLRANKDGRGVAYDNLVDTGTEFRRLMKAGDLAAAYKHFPFEFADCKPALEAAITLSATLPPALVWKHAMNDEIIEITSIVQHAGTLAKDSHVPWQEDEVCAARGKTAVLLRRFKGSTPLHLELSQTQHTVIADALAVLVARLAALGNVRSSTSTSFQDENFKTKTLKISSHIVRTLGDPLYLNNIRRRVMADYAHNATETRNVLIGMSFFGHSANDDKPYLLEYDILRKNRYEDIEFPNQNFLDSKTFNLLLPPNPDNLAYDQPVPQAMRHDYQALNPEHNMDRFAALRHLAAPGVEINEFRVCLGRSV